MILDLLSTLTSGRSPLWASRRAGPRLIVTALIVTILALMPNSESRAADLDNLNVRPVDLSAYEGHWERTDASECEAARKSSIEKAISGLSWIVRTMASGVLRRSTAPPPEMRFAWDGARLHQGMQDDAGGFSRIIELDGEMITRKDHRGVDFASAWTWTNDGLRLRWKQHQAEGNNLYRLDEEVGMLVVHHTINVTAISNVDSIIFESHFVRTNLPARAAAGLDHVARVAVD